MKIAVALLLFFSPVWAFAAPQPQDKYLADCHLTPSLAAHNYPGREGIISSNKLALPAGKSIYAKGELVYLSGRLFDTHCVPVSDAIIDIWQTNPAGNYAPSSRGERLDPYPHFTGTGRAVTDNLGRFNFVTLFPGPYTVIIRDEKGRIIRKEFHAPHINFHIVHQHFEPLDTEMFFSGDRRNTDDVDLQKLSPNVWPGVMAKVWPRNTDKPKDGLYGRWDITIPGMQFRHF